MAKAESSILIVDDDSEDMSALEQALASLGCNLHTVTDPHDVLPAVYRNQPDVVVLDALLPGLSGFDLCKQIKMDGELKGTQVVIITGVYVRQKYRQEALQQFKADGFLTKPFRAPELQRLVVELLAKKTRKPQSSFLDRLGLSSKTPSPKQRGFFGKLFGKEEEPVPAQDAPVPPARTGELPRSRSGTVASPEFAPGPNSVTEADTSETMPDTAALDATVTDALQNETETAPAVRAPPGKPEVKDMDETEAAASKDPITTDEPATDAAVDEKEPEPEASVAEPSASDEPSAGAAVTKAVKAEDTPDPDKADKPGDVEPGDPSRARRSEPDAAASSSVAVRRPKFRVGEVPIYDEEDFHSELKRELSKCRRVDRPLTLILIQVDDLTQIVELFGEKVREPVLWHVAKQAMASLREVDLVGMLSSKDLIALTAFASDKYGGGRVVARMRKLLEKNPFRVGEELPPIIPALQFGMSSFPEDGDEVVGLIARAYEDIEH